MNLAPLARGGVVRARYYSEPDRRSLAQEIYRHARRHLGIRVHVVTEGGERGRLSAFAEIAGCCQDRRYAHVRERIDRAGSAIDAEQVVEALLVMGRHARAIREQMLVDDLEVSA